MTRSWIACSIILAVLASGCGSNISSQKGDVKVSGRIEVDERTGTAAVRAGQESDRSNHGLYLFDIEEGLPSADQVQLDNGMILSYAWVQSESHASLLLLVSELEGPILSFALKRVNFDDQMAPTIETLQPSGWPVESHAGIVYLRSNPHDRRSLSAFMHEDSMLSGDESEQLILISHDNGSTWESISLPGQEWPSDFVWINGSTLAVLFEDNRLAQIRTMDDDAEWEFIADSVQGIHCVFRGNLIYSTADGLYGAADMGSFDTLQGREVTDAVSGPDSLYVLRDGRTLSKYRSDGSMIWECALPLPVTSISHLLREENRLYGTNPSRSFVTIDVSDGSCDFREYSGFDEQ